MSGLRRGQFVARVGENVQLCREHWRLSLRVAAFPPTVPGQFVQIACRDLASAEASANEREWDPTIGLNPGEFAGGGGALLRRPFSLAGRRGIDGGVELDIIHRVVGVGTAWLSRLHPGDKLSILGPLGNGFVLPQPDALAVLVGGGVGIPPMLYLAQVLGERASGQQGANAPAGEPIVEHAIAQHAISRHAMVEHAIAFCGAVTQDLLPLRLIARPRGAEPALTIDELARHGIAAVVSTDDGTVGYKGLVTEALEAYLEGSGFGVRSSAIAAQRSGVGAGGMGMSDGASTSAAGARPIIYTCGPEGMMKRVAAIAAERGLDCQVAVERAMACGMGTCQSCVIRVKKNAANEPPLPGQDWCYRLACTDGPVFRGAELLW